MSAAVEAVQPPQAYPLSFIHSMVTKIAPTIDGWLPAAVHASLQELEVVVAQIAHAPPPSRQPHRSRDRHNNYQMGRSNFGSATSKGSGRPEWSNENWDNFRSFKATKVLSAETPVSRFRSVFNKLTAGTLNSSVSALEKIIAEEELENEGLVELAKILLKGCVASPGNCDLYAEYLSKCSMSGATGKSFTVSVLDGLRAVCVKGSSKVSEPENESYDALCEANEANDKATTFLKMAVLCEKRGVLASGSTGVLLLKVARRLSKLGADKQHKFTAEVLVSRLILVLEARGEKPSADMRSILNEVATRCEDKKNNPGLGNKVLFTLMDYFDTIE
jgi:hypothetical protein